MEFGIWNIELGGMREIVLIAHNLRSTHNVGSLLRTADGLGVAKVFLTGYTPYPTYPGDTRLPHLSRKIHAQIAKTALGAEQSQIWERRDDVIALLDELVSQGFTTAALEQTENSLSLPEYRPPGKVALILGREVEGIEPEVVAACRLVLEIPMFGQKESFNVVQAGAMAVYHCRFAPES